MIGLLVRRPSEAQIPAARSTPVAQQLPLHQHTRQLSGATNPTQTRIGSRAGQQDVFEDIFTVVDGT